MAGVIARSRGVNGSRGKVIAITLEAIVDPLTLLIWLAMADARRRRRSASPPMAPCRPRARTW
jgi:hypothetical protein